MEISLIRFFVFSSIVPRCPVKEKPFQNPYLMITVIIPPHLLFCKSQIISRLELRFVKLRINASRGHPSFLQGAYASSVISVFSHKMHCPVFMTHRRQEYVCYVFGAELEARRVHTGMASNILIL